MKASTSRKRAIVRARRGGVEIGIEKPWYPPAVFGYARILEALAATYVIARLVAPPGREDDVAATFGWDHSTAAAVHGIYQGLMPEPDLIEQIFGKQQ